MWSSGVIGTTFTFAYLRSDVLCIMLISSLATFSPFKRYTVGKICIYFKAETSEVLYTCNVNENSVTDALNLM